MKAPFLVVGPDGKRLFSIEAEEHPRKSVARLYAPNGKIAADLSADDKRSKLVLWNPSSPRLGVELVATPTYNVVALNNPQHKLGAPIPQAELWGTPTGGRIYVRDAKGNVPFAKP